MNTIFTYIIGIVIAVIINLIRLLAQLSIYFSIRATNFKKVGLFYNFATGVFSEDKPTTFLLLFSLLDALLITPLLSWLYVGYALWIWFSSYVNKVKAPEQFNELQFKLATVDLPKEIVEGIMAELKKYYGVSIKNDNTLLTDEEYEDTNILVINPGEYYSELRVMPSVMKYRWYYHSPDYEIQSKEIYQYEIEGTTVKVRLLERLMEEPLDKYFEVQDNVILESEIRKRHNNEGIIIRTLDEILTDLTKEIEWQEISTSKQKYFLLSKHPEVFSNFELRKHLRQELERIKQGVSKIMLFVEKHGLVIYQTVDNIIEIRYPKDSTEKQKTSLDQLYNSQVEKNMFTNYGITLGEFQYNMSLQNYLLELLGESNLKAEGKVNAKND
jgi:hypothetical protein